MKTTVDEGHQKATVESTIFVESEDKVDADQTDAINIVEERVQSEVMETTVDEGHQKATVESRVESRVEIEKSEVKHEKRASEAASETQVQTQDSAFETAPPKIPK
ncbi:MAG: uncharacterized protein KVP18_003801 [Porospora cf. gigantea A]|uniref:uncharacterized protein n=1 Tax=Porospora cf. gigantea A TaxID=2853593 RepID=UPI003559FA38|nr:MAG: hypothetical protein KVP18_003801 [Porospora cf. gigantea A]